MTKFKQYVNEMYFEGIKNGKITALIFDEEVFPEAKRGDILELFNTLNSIKMYFVNSKICSFKDITTNDAKWLGFATKDLLAAHLIHKYHYDIPLVNYKKRLSGKLFYIVYIIEDIEEEKRFDERFNKINPFECYLYDGKPLKTYLVTNYSYNPEYDEQPWRNV